MDEARALISGAYRHHLATGLKAAHAREEVAGLFGIRPRRVRMILEHEVEQIDAGLLARFRAAYRKHCVDWAARLEREAAALEREAARLEGEG